MLHLVEHAAEPLAQVVLRSMFAARKRVFVDLLKWDIPVIADAYEVDGFDDAHARYLIVSDHDGRHLASARLLPTTRPHLLDSYFAALCDGALPRGEDIFEITRFCLDRSLPAAGRRSARDALVCALVEYARSSGITTYIAIAEMRWYQQILAFGWCCRPLGLPRMVGADLLAALRIEIAPDTMARLARAGVIAPAGGASPVPCAA